MAVDIETCLELGKVHTAVGPENNIILFRIASTLEEVEKYVAGLVIYVASIRAATEMNTPQVREIKYLLDSTVAEVRLLYSDIVVGEKGMAETRE
jgi:hypothetical protein